MQIQLSPDEAAQGYPYPCEPGEAIEVPDDVGKSLLEQETKWLPVKAASKKKDD